MTTTKAIPIPNNWTTDQPIESIATAREVNALLAEYRVVEIVPYLAATAAELALVAGIPWRFTVDDAPVALLRLIAKVAIIAPQSSGPHTGRLHSVLKTSPYSR